MWNFNVLSTKSCDDFIVSKLYYIKVGLGRISGNIIFNLLYFTTKSLLFKIFKGCNFLIIEARRTMKYVHLYVNFILEISKHKFWGAAAVLGSY